MKKTILFLTLAAIICSCGPSIKRFGYGKRPEKQKCDITIVKERTDLSSGNKIGSILVSDNGLSFNCSEEDVIAIIKKEGCTINASYANLYNINYPSIWGSSCYQACADFYKGDIPSETKLKDTAIAGIANSSIDETKGANKILDEPKDIKKSKKQNQRQNSSFEIDTLNIRKGTELESWYFSFYLGYSDITYFNSLQRDIDNLKSMSGVDHTPLSIGFGVYFPFNEHKTMAGVVLQGSGDRFSKGSDFSQINTYLFGASISHSLTGCIGNGFFVKGDLGLSWMIIDDSGYYKPIASEKDLGFELNFGYMHPISYGTRIFGSVSWSNKSIESENVSSFNFNLGFLF